MSGARGGARAPGPTAAAVLRRTQIGGANSKLVDPNSQLAQGSGTDQFTDNVYVPRPFFSDAGYTGKDNQPVLPVSKQEMQNQRVAATANVLIQSWGAAAVAVAVASSTFSSSSSAAATVGDSASDGRASATGGMLTGWPSAAHPDDPRRNSGSAAVPNTRFPAELSERGQPLRRPKIKISAGAESRSLLRVSSTAAAAAAAAAAARRRSRDEEEEDDDEDEAGKKKKRSSALIAGKKDGKDDGAASVASNSESDDEASDSDEYSNHVASDDDDGGNEEVGDDELAF